MCGLMVGAACVAGSFSSSIVQLALILMVFASECYDYIERNLSLALDKEKPLAKYISISYLVRTPGL